MKKIIFLELFLRIIEDEKWNLFEILGQLRTPTGQQPGNYSCQRTFTKCARRRPLQAKYFLNLGNIFQYPAQYTAQYPGQGYQPAPQQPPPGYSQQAPYNPGY